MSEQRFFVKKNELTSLMQAAEQQKPAGKEFLGFVLRPGTGRDGKETYFPDPLFSDRPEPEGQTAFDTIREVAETPVCPYPPGYPANPSNGTDSQ